MDLIAVIQTHHPLVHIEVRCVQDLLWANHQEHNLQLHHVFHPAAARALDWYASQFVLVFVERVSVTVAILLDVKECHAFRLAI